MATSSTAFATHPTQYPPSLTPYSLNANTRGRQSNNDRRPANYSSRQPQPPPQTQPPTDALPPPATSAMPDSAAKRQPDWAEFYKNGMPKEIIVIDDDSPQPSLPGARTGTATRSGVNATVNKTDKKRKTGTATNHDPVYQQQTSYSTTQTPYAEHSSSHKTASTDRTTSAIHTTASTSLGSQAPPPEDAMAGQKRKRSTRQAQDEGAKEAKRRQMERPIDPYDQYMPPPDPPIKAKEVYVPVVGDVRASKGKSKSGSNSQQQRKHAKDQKCDDEDGHYIVNPEADLTDRYQIVRLLGQGTFGKVVEAYDKKNKQRCAIKVIRSVQKYRDASRIELRVLSTLASNDTTNRNRCIHLRDCFDFKNHICIVTDLYGQSVFDFLKANAFTPFPSTHIQEFGRQLLTSVAFLHDLNLIHTDLKPENILLVKNEYQTFTYNRTIPSSSTTVSRSARHRKVLLDPEIRLIDFGSATFNDEYHSSVVSTRHYRAPEIILNLGWSFPCDIWSIGCILVEFFTGDALFQTHDNLEHLAMMEPICGGKLDKDLIRQVVRSEKGHSKNAAAAYFKNNKLDYPTTDTPRTSRRYVKAMKKLNETILPYTEFNRQFLDLLHKIFVYNPSKRITAHEALQHQWFREPLADDGTEARRIREEKRVAKEEKEKAARRLNGYH